MVRIIVLISMAWMTVHAMASITLAMDEMRAEQSKLAYYLD